MQINTMDIIPLDKLTMVSRDIAIFRFCVNRNDITLPLVVSHHQASLDGFKLTVSTQDSHYNRKIINNEFSITLERIGESKLKTLDIILGVCTFPANKTVKTFNIAIN